MDDTFNAVFQDGDVEVDEQAGGKVRQLQVGEDSVLHGWGAEFRPP